MTALFPGPELLMIGLFGASMISLIWCPARRASSVSRDRQRQARHPA
jgi:hypothetical protein